MSEPEKDPEHSDKLPADVEALISNFNKEFQRAPRKPIIRKRKKSQ